MALPWHICEDILFLQQYSSIVECHHVNKSLCAVSEALQADVPVQAITTVCTQMYYGCAFLSSRETKQYKQCSSHTSFVKVVYVWCTPPNADVINLEVHQRHLYCTYLY